MRRYELTPNGTQKVSMEKPLLKLTTPGMKRFTAITPPIIKRLVNGSLVRLWGGWSNTTGKHIKAFCGLNKAGFMGLEHKPTPQEKAAAYNGTLYR